MIAGASFLLAVLLVTIMVFDFRRRVIPDSINLALAIVGAILAAAGGQAELVYSLVSAILTAVVFLLLRTVYFRLRCHPGLGMGDVKFLSAAAVWVGIEGIPWLVLIGCLSGLVFVIALHLSRRPVTMQTHIAFGPHLAVGMFATWMFKTSGVLYLGF